MPLIHRFDTNKSNKRASVYRTQPTHCHKLYSAYCSISPNDVASKIVVVVIAMVIKQTVLNFFLEKVYIQTEPV